MTGCPPALRRSAPAWSAGLAIAALAVLLPQAPSTGYADEDEPGLAVGKAAPAFTLKDQAGQHVSLEGLLETGKVVALVFHRSADW